MGAAVARRLHRLPDFELAFVVDRDIQVARRAAHGLDPGVRVSGAMEDLRGRAADIDVMVEATSSVYHALGHCLWGLDRGADVVLMNAEVDLAFGVPLRRAAESAGRLVSSDAGDQHGVLMRMAEELRLWGVRPLVYGNIKGFLDRGATLASIVDEARKRNLSPGQCCAYTDGSKLNVEMALVGNALGASPSAPGMIGRSCSHVTDVLGHLDAREDPGLDGPEVDYVLGAEPGGGVYIVGVPEDPREADMLTYYKIPSSGGRYLFHRPFHLCHLETPTAILRVARSRRPLPDGPVSRRLDVFAHAKGALRPGDVLEEAMGSDAVLGLVREATHGDRDGMVPQCLLQAAIERFGPLAVRREVGAGDPIQMGDLELDAPDAEVLTAALFADAERALPALA